MRWCVSHGRAMCLSNCCVFTPWRQANVIAPHIHPTDLHDVCVWHACRCSAAMAAHVGSRPRGTTLIDWQFDYSDGALAGPQPVEAFSSRSGSQDAPAEAGSWCSDDSVPPLGTQVAGQQAYQQAAQTPDAGPVGPSIAARFSRQRRRQRHGRHEECQAADAAAAQAAQMLSASQTLPELQPQVQDSAFDQLWGPLAAADDSIQPEDALAAAPSLAAAGGGTICGSTAPPVTPPQKTQEPGMLQSCATCVATLCCA